MAAQWAGRQSEALVTATLLMGLQTKRLCTQDRRGSRLRRVRVILYPVRCIARSGRPKKRTMLRIIGLPMFARAVCPRTSVAGSDWVLPKHRLIS